MDLTGQKYGKLLVIGYGHKEGNYHYYDCLCDCSKDLPSRLVVKIKGKHLRDGSTQSCGCIRSERATKLPKDNSSLFTKSEIKELPYYNEIKRIWKTNRSHCNPNNGDGHQSYIKKGIKFCDEWDNGFLGFIRFYLFCIDNGYVAGQSQIHRKNNMLGFSPENLEVIDKPKRKKKEAESKNKNEAIRVPSENKELIFQPKQNDNVADNTEEIFSVTFNKLGVRLVVDNYDNVGRSTMQIITNNEIAK